MDIELHCPLQGSKVNIWGDFLAKAGLAADSDAEQTVLIWDAEQLIAHRPLSGFRCHISHVFPQKQRPGGANPLST